MFVHKWERKEEMEALIVLSIPFLVTIGVVGLHEFGIIDLSVWFKRKKEKPK